MADFADAAGVSESSIDNIENGRQRGYSDATVAAVEAALGWEPGSFLQVVEGGGPTVTPDELMTRLRLAWPRLSVDARRMLVELAERALDRG
jgi:transcriptional regulator with XRE-family HTH domain